MAKAKKKAPEATAKSLAPEQYWQLGEHMSKYGGNVFTVAKSKFGVELTDDDFEKIAHHSGVHQCGLCSQWKDKSEMSSARGVCEECIDS